MKEPGERFKKFAKWTGEAFQRWQAAGEIAITDDPPFYDDALCDEAGLASGAYDFTMHVVDLADGFDDVRAGDLVVVVPGTSGKVVFLRQHEEASLIV